jgi:hypothetical protein
LEEVARAAHAEMDLILGAHSDPGGNSPVSAQRMSPHRAENLRQSAANAHYLHMSGGHHSPAPRHGGHSKSSGDGDPKLAAAQAVIETFHSIRT